MIGDNITKHDWVIDFDDEDNGKYYHVCTQCGAEYLGHKRRIGSCLVCFIVFAENFISETRKGDKTWLESLVFSK